MKVATSGQCSTTLYRKALAYMWIIGIIIIGSLFNYSELMVYSEVMIYILLFVLGLSIRLFTLGKRIEELENGVNAKR